MSSSEEAVCVRVCLCVLSLYESVRLFLDAGGRLGLRGVAGGRGGGLPRQGVHGPQELVCDAARLPQAAEQGAVHRGRVVPDGVLPREEQPRDGLRRGGEERGAG